MASRVLNKNAPNSKRLFDVITRQNIYVEGVKLDFANHFRTVARELSEEFDTLLTKVKYNTLDGMTKNELNQFIVTLRRSQSRIYNNYVEVLLNQLYKFMVVDKSMTKRIYGSLITDEFVSESESDQLIEEEKKTSLFLPLFGWASLVQGAAGDDRLWSQIQNSPLPANGVLMSAFIMAFSRSAQGAVENLVRQGYVNRWTKEQLRSAVIGPKGRLDTTFTQHSAVTATVLQHISQSVGAAVASAFAGNYRWDSIMDSVTTDICRGRNRQIYQYGNGPIPPAHIRCRSRITPIFSSDLDDDSANQTLYTWLRQQPKGFLDDVFNAATADALTSGKARAKDFTEYQSEKPISVTQYADKLSDILSKE